MEKQTIKLEGILGNALKDRILKGISADHKEMRVISELLRGDINALEVTELFNEGLGCQYLAVEYVRAMGTEGEYFLVYHVTDTEITLIKAASSEIREVLNEYKSQLMEQGDKKLFDFVNYYNYSGDELTGVRIEVISDETMIRIILQGINKDIDNCQDILRHGTSFVKSEPYNNGKHRLSYKVRWAHYSGSMCLRFLLRFYRGGMGVFSVTA